MKRILIIDDEAGCRQSLEKALKLAGYEVETAEHGRAALELYRRQPADLVLTDLVMPEKEGLETIAEIRALHPGQKIIAMSGGGRIGPETYLAIAEGLGAARTLSKPFSIRELLSSVDALLTPAADLDGAPASTVSGAR